MAVIYSKLELRSSKSFSFIFPVLRCIQISPARYLGSGGVHASLFSDISVVLSHCCRRLAQLAAHPYPLFALRAAPAGVGIPVFPVLLAYGLECCPGLLSCRSRTHCRSKEM